MKARTALATLFALLLAASAMGADFDISFTQPAQLGSIKLEAGRYRLEVRGSVAVFIETATKKSYTAITRVDKTGRKSGFSAVLGSVVDGVQRVDSIILSGADFKLAFGD